MQQKTQWTIQRTKDDTSASVSFSLEKIAFCMDPDAIKEGSFVITGDPKKKIRGRVYTTHWRMQCRPNDRFMGTSCEIGFVFDSTGMYPGDTVKGLFQVVTDIGEYRLPFAVTAVPRYITTSEGTLRSLSDFLHLTDVDLDGAYQAFSHPRFCHTLAGEDEKLLRWYEGLTHTGMRYEAMLAFLKLVGHAKEEQEQPSLKAELHKYYKQSNFDFEKLAYRKQIVQLMRLYLQFRSMSISLEDWAKESAPLLEALMAKGKYRDFYYMGMVHLHILEGNTALAKKQVNEYADTHYNMRRNPELYGYYLYLCALLRKSDAFLEQVCMQIRALVQKHRTSGMLLWILQMVDKELLQDDEKRCQMMEELHNAGVHTPILYMEAAMLYRQNPELIGELTDFEVQVLSLAKRYHLLNQDIMERVIRLALRYRTFSVTMYTILKTCYAANPESRCIHAICTLLIKGDKVGEEYFKWYAKGVEANLRIARLYDYYMYSMVETMDTPIPEAVLLYFRYNQDLDYRKKSYLFANLTRFQKQYPDLYENYQQDCIDFVLHQLSRGRINPYLMYLYQTMVTRQFVSQKNAYHLADFIFSYRITKLPRGTTAVIVREPALEEELVSPVADGEAIAMVYTTDACIFYQDAQGNRQAATDRSHFERWFDREELLDLCGRYCPAHPGIMLRSCEPLVHGLDSQWQITLAQMTAEKQFSFAFRMQLWQKMLDYFYESYDNDALEWCLQHIHLQDLPKEKRAQNMELLLSQGHYDEAFAYVSTYGCEHIDSRPLVRLCSRMICKWEFAYQESLLALCREVFYRGKYDEMMLLYLLDHMDGGSKELQLLWQAGEEFGLDTYKVAKKLVTRFLKSKCPTDRLMDVFESYYKNCGRDNLVYAFLSYFAGEILQKGLQADIRIFEWIRKELVRGFDLNEQCRAAWLYGITIYPEVLGGEMELAADILDDFLNNGRVFAFYAKLPWELVQDRLISEQSYIEYHTDASHHVTLHYAVTSSESEGLVFVTEELEQSLPGIFVKELFLFSDETVRYYITEQSQEKEWIAAGGIQDGSGRPVTKSDRYGRLEALLDGKPSEEELAAYLQESYVTRQMFGQI